MDASVLAAIAKWPNVPAVFGWLSLSARGEWRIRNEPIGHVALGEFIGRNYAVDERGRWFFQNGPQRVFVELAMTPWVYRLDGGALAAHTGARPVECHAAALVSAGHFLVQTELGPGVIDDRDAALCARAVTDRAGVPLDDAALERWLEGARDAYFAPRLVGLSGLPRVIERVDLDALATRFGYVARPQP